MPSRVALVSLSVAVSLAALPLGRGVAVADGRAAINLVATSDGEEVAASGRAEIRSSNMDDVQTLTVEVGVAVPDGTSVFVFANGRPAGGMTVDGGIGSLDLTGEAGSPLAGGVEVCSIGPVWVTDARGTALLTGSF